MIIFVFILILAVLILIHELGHFVMAKLTGVKVEEFAFGFPPRVLSVKKGETNYSLNLVPIGGYVKMLGEDNASKDPRSFAMKPVLSRLLIVVSGVIMNLVLAVVLLTIGFMIGMTPIQTDPATLGGTQKPIILVTDILPNSAASKAKLQPGDEIISLTNKTGTQAISSAKNLQETTKAYTGQEVSFSVKRNNKVINLTATLGSGEAPLGVGLAQTALVKLSFIGAIKSAFVETGRSIYTLVSFVKTALGSLFIHGKVSSELGGPVAIYSFTGQAVRLGLTYVIQLTALLSINLAILNILPVPALDGGRGLFIILEGLFGRRIVKEHIEGLIHTIGFIVLVLLLLAITARDIIRLY